jgi:hypothetical protein
LVGRDVPRLFSFAQGWNHYEQNQSEVIRQMILYGTIEKLDTTMSFADRCVNLHLSLLVPEEYLNKGGKVETHLKAIEAIVAAQKRYTA